jgi:hypothetical protein
MGRKFDVALAGRPLRVCVSPVDEAWELWVCDRQNRLALGARIEIDDALAAYREGRDPIATAGRLIAAELEGGRFKLPAGPSRERCPTR